MKISDIDKNFAVESSVPMKDVRWLDPTEAPFRINGLWRYENGKPFLRMPEDVASAVNSGVRSLIHCTAGGRIRFRTNSPYVALKVKTSARFFFPHMTLIAEEGFDLYYDTPTENQRYCQSFRPSSAQKGYETWVNTDGTMHTYTMNMPLYGGIDEIYLGLSENAQLEAAPDYALEKPILYYGSSITQGGCASRPGNSYQAIISRRLDCDYINLGFSGSGRGEPAMAEYLASLDASVFVCDYDHNAPSPEHLEKTLAPLYAIYRHAHPDTPIIFVSKPDYHPGNANDEARRQIIRGVWEAARAAGDNRVWFVDGSIFFAGDLYNACTVDGCHPNDLGFWQMAEHIGKAVTEALTVID